ncbi:chromosome segregation in meiosis protein 3 [Histoplasma ohiense]|nr:chromosome segregation in meiosis protein 3 [Histoplasma ohiense (nom. inval.)]
MEARGQNANTIPNHTPPTIDDLFDYDAGLDEILGDTEGNQHNNSSNPTSGSNNAPADSNGASLGLDEEIKVAPKRRPVPKLDEARLLSPAGIPKLRRDAKKLKFRGKGHEYSDAMRLLNFYQLWLDDLYPRAKFADGLAIIEKLGHSKRVQIMRKEWINEGKLRPDAVDRDEEASNDTTQLPAANDAVTRDERDQNEDVELFPAATTNTTQREARTSPTRENLDTTDVSTENQIPSIFGGGGGGGKMAEHNFGINADSDDDLFVRDDRNDNARASMNVPPGHDENAPEDDELDALLAEHEGGGMPSEREPKPSTTTTIPKGAGPSSGLPQVGGYDDLDAMDDYDF